MKHVLVAKVWDEFGDNILYEERLEPNERGVYALGVLSACHIELVVEEESEDD